MAMSVDSQRQVQRLLAGGFSREQAEGLLEALAEALQEARQAPRPPELGPSGDTLKTALRRLKMDLLTGFIAALAIQTVILVALIKSL